MHVEARVRILLLPCVLIAKIHNVVQLEQYLGLYRVSYYFTLSLTMQLKQWQTSMLLFSFFPGIALTLQEHHRDSSGRCGFFLREEQHN